MKAKIALSSTKNPDKDYHINQQNLVRKIEAVANNGVDILFFPEMSLYFHLPDRTPPEDEIELLEPIRKATKSAKIWTIVPTNILIEGQVRNRAYLIDRNGNIAGKYDKHYGFYDKYINEEEYKVFKTDFGTIGIAICYDLGFEEPVRALANNGAEIVFAPIHYGKEEEKDQAQFVKCVPFTRAYENKVFVCAVNVAKGYPYAAICSPRGKLFEWEGKPEEEHTLIGEIDTSLLAETRKFYQPKTLVKNSDKDKYKWLQNN